MIGGPSIAAGSFIIPTAVFKADSSGRRNTVVLLPRQEMVENFSRCFPAERFARPGIEGMGYGIEFSICVTA